MIYYRQQQPHSCAIACIRMVLSNENEPPSEGVLISLLGCTEKEGTNIENVKSYLKWIGYEISESDDLETLTAKGYSIIAVIQKQHRKHAVVVQAQKNTVKIFDPEIAIYEMPAVDFERIYTGKHIAVRKNMKIN